MESLALTKNSFYSEFFWADISYDIDSSSLQNNNNNDELILMESDVQQQKQPAALLWQFLLELLEETNFKHLIRWTSIGETNNNEHDNEFVLLNPVEVARLWSLRRNKSTVNYKKFKRTLRYYYNKSNVLRRPTGKRNTYYFQINIQPYLQQLHWQQDQFRMRQLFNPLHSYQGTNYF